MAPTGDVKEDSCELTEGGAAVPQEGGPVLERLQGTSASCSPERQPALGSTPLPKPLNPRGCPLLALML